MGRYENNLSGLLAKGMMEDLTGLRDYSNCPVVLDAGMLECNVMQKTCQVWASTMAISAGVRL